MIIRYAVLSQDLVYNVGSLTCWCITDSFRGSETVSCHLVQNVQGRKKKCTVHCFGIDVYLCHQHITSKYSNSPESPPPTPQQNRREIIIRAAGNAREGTHSLVPSFSRAFIPPAPARLWRQQRLRGRRLPPARAPPAPAAPTIPKGCFPWQAISAWMTLGKGKLTAMVTAISTNSLCWDWWLMVGRLDMLPGVRISWLSHCNQQVFCDYKFLWL